MRARVVRRKSAEVKPARKTASVDVARRASHRTESFRPRPMERRDLLRALGSATALAILPHEALAAWTRVAARATEATPSAFTPSQLALIGAVADTIIPRTDTPGAVDVGVPAFIDVIVSENYDDSQREAFLAGLDAIDAKARSDRGDGFASLSSDARASVLDALEGNSDRSRDPERTYWRLKSLVIHGYFTSEPVMKDVLKVVVMPGRFDGAAPHVRRAS